MSVDGQDVDDELIETMTNAAGALNVDEKGDCSCQDQFTGLDLLEKIRECCMQLLRRSSKDQDWQPVASFLPRVFDVPGLFSSGSDSLLLNITASLPTRDVA